MKKVALTIILLTFSFVAGWATNRALLIGIGQYAPNTGWKTIHGDADIALLKPRLEKQGFKVNTLINEEATKDAIIKAFYSLLDECQTGDKVYIHFSGHGQLIEDVNGDENDGLDETLVPFDAGKYYEKDSYEGDRHLIDDEYNRILAEIKKKIGVTGEMLVAVDACYSKSVERGECDIDDIDILESSRGTADEFTFDGDIPNSVKEMPLPSPFDEGAGLVVITACKENERNYEYKTTTGKMYGSLSFCIAELLRENADFNEWEQFFKEEKYRSKKFFQTSQHPTIIIYN